MKTEIKTEAFEIESFNNEEDIQELKNTLKMIRKQKTTKLLLMLAIIIATSVFCASLQKHGENTLLVSIASVIATIFSLCALKVIVTFIKFIRNGKRSNG